MTARYESLLAGTTAPGIFLWAGDAARDLTGLAVDSGWEALSLDTSGVTDREGFYEELSTGWGLPPWFGNNLDALFDMLGEITAIPTILIWDDAGHLGAAEPDLVLEVIDVLRDCVGQAESFSVILRGETGLSGFDALL
ncbi:MAG: barstar family protein [Actinomycetota bacterium]|nr:barstar family protein [Actinomycetota bacterium]